MISDEINKVIVWVNEETELNCKGIDSNIIIVKDDTHKSAYDCFMKIKDKAIEITFPQFDMQPVLFEVENDEIAIFINQIYGMICKSQVVGVDISEIAECISNIKSGKFITELISKQDTEQVTKVFRTKLHKGRTGIIFRVEGDITLSESTELADNILDETSKEDTIDVFSVTYESDNYQDTKRISMWY